MARLGVVGSLCTLLVALTLVGVGCNHGGPTPRTATFARVDRGLSQERPPVKVLSLDVSYELDSAGRWKRTFRRRYEVTSDEGVRGWGGTGGSWSPWFEARPEVEATVTAPGGQVFTLDPAAITVSPVYPDTPDVYSDARTLRAPLPSVSVGAVVDETIVSRMTKPFFAGGPGDRITFQGGVPRERVRVTIDAPARAPFSYELRDLEAEVRDETKAGRRRVVVSGGPYPATKPIDPFAPPEVVRWPSLVLGAGDSWQRIAAAYGKLVEDRVATLAVPDVVRGLPQPGDDLRTKAQRVLDWMRDHVRYVGVELGDAALVPHSPVDTLSRGYGDCKDQATLLVALLRGVGIGAEVALLRAGLDEDVSPAVPSIGFFNHAIVVLPDAPGGPLWIDPTSEYARVGELPAPGAEPSWRPRAAAS